MAQLRTVHQQLVDLLTQTVEQHPTISVHDLLWNATVRKSLKQFLITLTNILYNEDIPDYYSLVLSVIKMVQSSTIYTSLSTITNTTVQSIPSPTVISAYRSIVITVCRLFILISLLDIPCQPYTTLSILYASDKLFQPSSSISGGTTSGSGGSSTTGTTNNSSMLQNLLFPNIPHELRLKWKTLDGQLSKLIPANTNNSYQSKLLHQQQHYHHHAKPNPDQPKGTHSSSSSDPRAQLSATLLASVQRVQETHSYFSIDYAFIACYILHYLYPSHDNSYPATVSHQHYQQPSYLSTLPHGASTDTLRQRNIPIQQPPTHVSLRSLATDILTEIRKTTIAHNNTVSVTNHLITLPILGERLANLAASVKMVSKEDTTSGNGNRSDHLTIADEFWEFFGHLTSSNGDIALSTLFYELSLPLSYPSLTVQYLTYGYYKEAVQLSIQANKKLFLLRKFLFPSSSSSRTTDDEHASFLTHGEHGNDDETVFKAKITSPIRSQPLVLMSLSPRKTVPRTASSSSAHLPSSSNESLSLSTSHIMYGTNDNDDDNRTADTLLQLPYIATNLIISQFLSSLFLFSSSSSVPLLSSIGNGVPLTEKGSFLTGIPYADPSTPFLLYLPPSWTVGSSILYKSFTNNDYLLQFSTLFIQQGIQGKSFMYQNNTHLPTVNYAYSNLLYSVRIPDIVTGIHSLPEYSPLYTLYTWINTLTSLQTVPSLSSTFIVTISRIMHYGMYSGTTRTIDDNGNKDNLKNNGSNASQNQRVSSPVLSNGLSSILPHFTHLLTEYSVPTETVVTISKPWVPNESTITTITKTTTASHSSSLFYDWENNRQLLQHILLFYPRLRIFGTDHNPSTKDSTGITKKAVYTVVTHLFRYRLRTEIQQNQRFLVNQLLSMYPLFLRENDESNKTYFTDTLQDTLQYSCRYLTTYLEPFLALPPRTLATSPDIASSASPPWVPLRTQAALAVIRAILQANPSSMAIPSSLSTHHPNHTFILNKLRLLSSTDLTSFDTILTDNVSPDILQSMLKRIFMEFPILWSLARTTGCGDPSVQRFIQRIYQDITATSAGLVDESDQTLGSLLQGNPSHNAASNVNSPELHEDQYTYYESMLLGLHGIILDIVRFSIPLLSSPSSSCSSSSPSSSIDAAVFWSSTCQHILGEDHGSDGSRTSTGTPSSPLQAAVSSSVVTVLLTLWLMHAQYTYSSVQLSSFSTILQTIMASYNLSLVSASVSVSVLPSSPYGGKENQETSAVLYTLSSLLSYAIVRHIVIHHHSSTNGNDNGTVTPNTLPYQTLRSNLVTLRELARITPAVVARPLLLLLSSSFVSRLPSVIQQDIMELRTLVHQTKSLKVNDTLNYLPYILNACDSAHLPESLALVLPRNSATGTGTNSKVFPVLSAYLPSNFTPENFFTIVCRDPGFHEFVHAGLFLITTGVLYSPPSWSEPQYVHAHEAIPLDVMPPQPVNDKPSIGGVSTPARSVPNPHSISSPHPTTPRVPHDSTTPSHRHNDTVFSASSASPFNITTVLPHDQSVHPIPTDTVPFLATSTGGVRNTSLNDSFNTQEIIHNEIQKRITSTTASIIMLSPLVTIPPLRTSVSLAAALANHQYDALKKSEAKDNETSVVKDAGIDDDDNNNEPFTVTAPLPLTPSVPSTHGSRSVLTSPQVEPYRPPLVKLGIAKDTKVTTPLRESVTVQNDNENTELFSPSSTTMISPLVKNIQLLVAHPHSSSSSSSTSSFVSSSVPSNDPQRKLSTTTLPSTAHRSTVGYPSSSSEPITSPSIPPLLVAKPLHQIVSSTLGTEVSRIDTNNDTLVPESTVPLSSIHHQSLNTTHNLSILNSSSLSVGLPTPNRTTQRIVGNFATVSNSSVVFTPTSEPLPYRAVTSPITSPHRVRTLGKEDNSNRTASFPSNEVPSLSSSMKLSSPSPSLPPDTATTVPRRQTDEVFPNMYIPTNDTFIKGVMSSLVSSMNNHRSLTATARTVNVVDTITPPPWLSPASSLSSASHGSNALPLTVPVSDLGKEFSNVLAEEYAKQGNWTALREMGALGNIRPPNSVPTTVKHSSIVIPSPPKIFHSIAQQYPFLPPPPLSSVTPSPRYPSHTQPSLPTPQSHVVSPRRLLRHPDAFHYSSSSSTLTTMNNRIPDRTASADPATFTDTSVSLPPFTFTIPDHPIREDKPLSDTVDGPQTVASNPLDPFERVKIQMNLLSVQASALSEQADALEAEFNQENAIILDTQQQAEILHHRQNELHHLRTKADQLLFETTKELMHP